MSAIVPTVVSAGMTFAFVALWAKWQQAARAEYIRQYKLPMGLFDKLRKARPQLSPKDCQLVAQALRQFFIAHLKSGRKFVSMPSQVADDLWHEFILYTKHYQEFCKRAFGKFMHHTPAAVMSSNRQSNAGLRRCWWFACKEDNIDPRKATRLPLLFALDAKLNIEGGFCYAPDCKGFRSGQDDRSDGGVTYCATDFSDSSFDGGTDGFGDSGSGDSSSDGGDSGGGDGCGGGGCGGGD